MSAASQPYAMLAIRIPLGLGRRRLDGGGASSRVRIMADEEQRVGLHVADEEDKGLVEGHRNRRRRCVRRTGDEGGGSGGLGAFLVEADHSLVEGIADEHVSDRAEVRTRLE